MAVDQARSLAPEAQRMNNFRNVMMFKRPDFGTTIGNAGAAAKRQASPDEETSEEAGRCVPDSGTRSR
jgi:hypothetical protein